MKIFKVLCFLWFVTMNSVVHAQEQPMAEVVNNALDFSLRQSLRMATKYADSLSVLPRSFEDGKMVTSRSSWWCSGFFPGTLWYLYEYSQDQEVLGFARNYTSRIEREKNRTSHHDIGFMLYCSFGNGYRLTGDVHYRDVLLTGARSLATRFNPNIGLIRSWDWNRHRWQYPVIIDNMMNLELLLWASRTLETDTFYTVAKSHADKTLLHHYRDDESSFHVVSYDTLSAAPHVRETFQGYSDESSWSRGQAWGLYGYMFMYRETGEPRYLGQALKITDFLINHTNMPEDYIPYWDFDAPDIHNALRDASAGAIIASAWLELSQYVDSKLAARLRDIVETQLRTLASPAYTAAPGENGDFILKHSVGFFPEGSEVDVPLTYADYYYVEALMRYKKLFGV